MILRLMKLVTEGILYTLYNRPLFFFKYFGVVAMYSCTLWEHALEVEAVAETYRYLAWMWFGHSYFLSQQKYYIKTWLGLD